MPLLYKKQDSELLYGIWKVTESNEELSSFLIHSHFDYTNNRQRIQEKLAVRVLLKTLLKDEERKIEYYLSGKPYFSDNKWHISISHTKGYVALALHPTSEIGLDIEQYNDRVRRVSSRFIRPDEESTVSKAIELEEIIPSRSNEIYAMLLHWSAKETIFKIMGEIDVDLLNNMRVYPFDLRQNGTFQAQELGSTEKQIFQIHYFLYPDFVFTYTVSST
ncbi:4'-phosphopantetheinyl transferase family protein [Phocaeicola oris]|uniref:4'-phosphopantetheinyl transferase family protein n=1 Tax=Phocaeicola oris TaxID=2896850 RepID=UPI00234EC0C6|nr:4'-phosphopantetheinyl transferase superfamily protein [Phocaeicola oris]MCE2615542.1 4'-phosphopantetheinyl transferase superfamily protein [Phocaeicola oris]